MIRLEHLELIADRISSMVWWKLLREDLRLPRWEGMAKLSLGVTAVGVEIATKSLTSCGLPKLRSKKSGGGWCVMVLWRFGWLVGLWDAFMTCYLWEKKLSKSCLFDVKDSNGQCQALLWPRLSFPVIFNVVSFMHPSILWQRVPTTLSRLRTFICKRATCATTRGQSWALPEKCIFGYLLNKDARHIIVAGKEIFNDVLGHVWNKEAWGVWHISFLQWNIVKAFFSERKRNESFQTKRKSIRNFARVPWQPLVSWAIWCHETWPFYDWSIWCEAGPFVAIDGFPGSTSCGFPNVQVATLAQLDAQLRASQTDFWGMWGEWWEGDGWEMRARRA